MFPIPRVALGTVQPQADLTAVCWAMLEVLRRGGLQVQSFLSQACFTGYHGPAAICGSNPRHLDSWLMSPETSREVFAHGVGGSDFALVEGKFSPATTETAASGGRLEALCDWLDLAALAVIDVSQWEACRLPARPPRADGLLLDRAAPGAAQHIAANLEALWGLPVLGALDDDAELRAALRALPTTARPPSHLYAALGDRLIQHWHWRRIDRLAARPRLGGVPTRLFRSQSCGPTGTTIALAYDDAFNCYFPDTLDLLELRGATIVDFSPLRDERLPAGVEVVYFGCGQPERFAAELAANDCMKLALRDHLRHGGRIYAEGGGLAYLCQALEAPSGELHRMVGVFPAIACWQNEDGPPAAAELLLSQSSWLGPTGSLVRGYRNPRWTLEATGPVTSLAQSGKQLDLIQAHGAVGSRLHLNFAAQPHLLGGFSRGFCQSCPRCSS